MKQKEYKVFVEDEESYKREPATLIKDHENKKMKIRFKNMEKEVDFDGNWHKTLRNLDLKLNNQDYKIICNGTSKNVISCGMCVNMGDGSKSYRFVEKKPVPIDTLSYSEWNEYSTYEEQKKILK